MDLILTAEDPLKTTWSEAVISYAPTVIMFVVFILIVIYCIRIVVNKYFRKKNGEPKVDSYQREDEEHLVE